MYSATDIFPNPTVAEAVTEYSTANSTSLGTIINQHRQATIDFTATNGLDPNPMINTLQAQTIVFLAKLHGVKRVLEIGCFTGYSALCWAHAVSAHPDGEVITLDIEYEATAFARAAFKKTGADKVIQLITGDAATTIQTLTGEFDLIFIDANKDGYIGYLEKILSQKLLSPTGFILADNTLLRGLVAEKESVREPPATERNLWMAEHIERFNAFVVEHPELENVLLPAFDGLNMIRYRDGSRK